MSLVTIEQVINNRNKELMRKKAENELLNKQIKTQQIRLQQLTDNLSTIKEALKFLEVLANSRRSNMKSQIEKVVSEALTLIYGNEYSIELVYDTKNNRSNMEIELVRNSPVGIVRRKMEGFGGGVSDTISVPLRLLVLLASRKTDKVCILDECYKHVSPDLIDRVAEFINQVSHNLGLQIIMCSHHEIMKDVADVAWKIEDVNGRAECERYNKKIIEGKSEKI
jgi:DNA repair exonuclease SbcCD ATPase subunit